MSYSIKNALEQTQEDLSNIDSAPPVDTGEVLEIEEGIDGDLIEAENVSEDMTVAVNAHDSLESLVVAMEADAFLSHAATPMEIHAYRMALESYGLEDDAPVQEGETKSSLLDRAKKKVSQIWEWITAIAKRAADWSVELLNKLARPMLTYEKRANAMVALGSDRDFKQVKTESYNSMLGSEKGVIAGIRDYLAFCKKTTDSLSSLDIQRVFSKLAAGTSAGDDIAKCVGSLESAFSSYGTKSDEGIVCSFIAGHTFTLKAASDKKGMTHSYSQNDPKGPCKEITEADIPKLRDVVIESVKMWKEIQKTVTDMKLVKLADLTKQAKSAVSKTEGKPLESEIKAMQPFINTPLLKLALVLTRLAGAALSFGEAHYGLSAGEHYDRTKNKVSKSLDDAKKSTSDKFNSVKNSAKEKFESASKAARDAKDKYFSKSK